jgi:hypothetical protein
MGWLPISSSEAVEYESEQGIQGQEQQKVAWKTAGGIRGSSKMQK